MKMITSFVATVLLSSVVGNAVAFDAIVAAPGTPKVLPLAGSGIDVLVPAAATNGEFSAVLIHDKPGGGPMPMGHGKETETFYVVEGRYQFLVGDKTYEEGPGAIVVNPVGVVHGFKVIGDAPGTVLAIYTPGGFEGFFTKWFETGANTPAAIGALEVDAGIIGSGVATPK